MEQNPSGPEEPANPLQDWEEMIAALPKAGGRRARKAGLWRYQRQRHGHGSRHLRAGGKATAAVLRQRNKRHKRLLKRVKRQKRHINASGVD